MVLVVLVMMVALVVLVVLLVTQTLSKKEVETHDI